MQAHLAWLLCLTGASAKWCRPSELLSLGSPLSRQRSISPKDCTMLHVNGTARATEVLAVLENYCTRLEAVDLRGAQIGAAGAQALARFLLPTASLGCPLLSRLNLRNNQIGDKGAVVLFGALAGNTKLNILDVSDNGISDEGVVSLVVLLLKGHSHLTELRLSGIAMSINGSLVLAAAIKSGSSPRLAKITCFRTATVATCFQAPPMELEESSYYVDLSSKFRIDDAWRSEQRLSCRFLVDAGIEDFSSNNCSAVGALVMQYALRGKPSSTPTDAFMAYMTNEPMGILARAIRIRGLVLGAMKGRVDAHYSPFDKLAPKGCFPPTTIPKVTSVSLVKEDRRDHLFSSLVLTSDESAALKAAVARATGVYVDSQSAPLVTGAGPDDLLAAKTVLAVSVNTAYFKCNMSANLLFHYTQNLNCSLSRVLCCVRVQSMRIGFATRNASGSSTWYGLTTTSPLSVFLASFPRETTVFMEQS